MSYKRVDNIEIEDARIIFRNFAGKETKFNREGNRNFCVVIDDPSQVNALTEDGWNIRLMNKREEDEEARYYLPVTISFQNIPPKVFLVTRKNKVPMTEEMIGELDTAEIRNVDLSIRPYNWEVNGKTGVKAYVKTMYVTKEEDEFASKYARDEEQEEMPF